MIKISKRVLNLRIQTPRLSVLKRMLSHACTNTLSPTITHFFDSLSRTNTGKYYTHTCTHLAQWKCSFWSHFVCACEDYCEFFPIANTTPVSVSTVHIFTVLRPFRRHSACDMFKPCIRTTWMLRVGSLVWLCARVNASGSRNLHIPCKLHRWSSTHSASSGVSASSDTAKCVSQAACMHTRFQRCFRSQPWIIQQTVWAPILFYANLRSHMTQ